MPGVACTHHMMHTGTCVDCTTSFERNIVWTRPCFLDTVCDVDAARVAEVLGRTMLGGPHTLFSFVHVVMSSDVNHSVITSTAAAPSIHISPI